MYNEIVEEFGETVASNNEIDREVLGNIIYNNKEKRLKLNAITHPRVINQIHHQISRLVKKGQRLIVLDIPLLFEADLEYMTDLIMLAYVDPPTQVSRLMARDDISEESARMKISSQYNLEIKKEIADIVINNNLTLEKTNKQLFNIYKQLRSEGYVS